ncbi:Lrp/AsnC ligand binding domain-containing protein [Actinophytocola oryzae]|uniref:AsnC-like helix-turn-helix protein n=1 Tax=Actinophytocola oryzae TaxID=502181 RepID=A0A4R7V4P6_9PSEU|nr:Lrp/AsnC ligand binding domain-containing protein [Actinophytocola oryzae]TDV44329.1 AsnC-like helix-turn-helix protein [Actinophytocola oryzae]
MPSSSGCGLRPAPVRGQALADHPEVAFAAATTGPTNLAAAVVCRDVYELHDYLTGRLGTLTAIRGIETDPVIRTLKGAAPILRLPASR